MRLRRACAFSVALIVLLLTPLSAQQRVPPGVQDVSLAEVVQRLPDFATQGSPEGMALVFAVNNASKVERTAALPGIMRWIDDDRPKVRSMALFMAYGVSLPAGPPSDVSMVVSLPQEYFPAVAAHIRDSDPRVRQMAMMALQPSLFDSAQQIQQLVLPLLQDPSMLKQEADPSAAESTERMAASMPREARARFLAIPPRVLPATGPSLLYFVVNQRAAPSPAVDQAVIAFLDRTDQTPETIGDSLHTLALARADEVVNDEALRRVFELKAMNVFLLQFVTQMQLTPAQLGVQKTRLLALASDPTTGPQLRHAAQTIAACWSGDVHRSCKPDPDDFVQRPMQQTR